MGTPQRLAQIHPAWTPNRTPGRLGSLGAPKVYIPMHDEFIYYERFLQDTGVATGELVCLVLDVVYLSLDCQLLLTVDSGHKTVRTRVC